MGGTRAELRLQRPEKSLEEVEHQRVRTAHDVPYPVVHQRREHDRPRAPGHGCAGDARDRFPRSLLAVDERDDRGSEADAVELGQQAVAQCLGGEAGAIRDEKDGAIAVGHGATERSGRVADKI